MGKNERRTGQLIEDASPAPPKVAGASLMSTRKAGMERHHMGMNQFAKEDASLTQAEWKLLRKLQADGRISNADLAREANMSPATCFRRTQRLFEEGFIKSVRAEIDPAKVGRGSLIFVGVVLDRSTPESFEAFETAVCKIPMILDCHLVAGDFDYFLKIRVDDMSEFNKLHANRLIALPAVRQTRTFFVMKEVIDNAPLPI